ncbi:MAG: TonB-dependent receptor domain-containing protein [Methylophilaceae bacterium]
MKKTLISSLIGLSFTSPLYSAENIQLDDVVVTATRVPQPRESVIADVSVINADEIMRGGQTTLVELLQLQPGIEITSNGGAGKTAGIFMRGTSSGQVIVLIDGMRINSATTGATTFENLPLGQIERIEILRGPATSLYGQDAIGGVIQIFTKTGEGKTRVYASAGYGTYRNKTGETGVRGKINDTSFAFNLSGQDIDGFSALDSNNPNFNDDDSYRNLSVSGNLSQKLAEGHEMGVQFFNSDGYTQFDNRFNATAFSSKAKLNQQTAALFSNNQFASFWLSKLRVGLSKDKLKSFDEFSAPSFDRFDTEQTQINWQNDVNLPVGTLTLMYDKLEEDIKSNTLYNKTNRSNEGYVASYLANVGAHSVSLSYRDDHNSQFGNNHTGGIGYGYNFSPNWRATASYGSAFKAPTFNDLYFPDFFGFPTSNPNLKPEKSDNVEASVRYQDAATNASLTVYENKVRNLIALDTNFVPFNANKATLTGLTLAVNHQLGNWNFGGSADIQSPRDDETNNLLVRRANRHAKLNLAYHRNDWQFGAEMTSSSARYNDTANTRRMSGYSLFNFTAAYKLNSDWSVQARLNNAFDKDYVLAYDGAIPYNTAGANLFVNIRYQPE